MPRKKTTAKAPSEESVSKEQYERDAMYSAYVHGQSINDIAERFHLESLEVLEVIQAVEAARK